MTTIVFPIFDASIPVVLTALPRPEDALVKFYYGVTLEFHTGFNHWVYQSSGLQIMIRGESFFNVMAQPLFCIEVTFPQDPEERRLFTIQKKHPDFEAFLTLGTQEHWLFLWRALCADGLLRFYLLHRGYVMQLMDDTTSFALPELMNSET